MNFNYKIFLLVILTFILRCLENESNDKLTDSNDGYGKLLINTDTTIYSWQLGESQDCIIIRGTLNNESDSVYYTRIGEGFGLPEQIELLIAGNSAGYIEKCDITTVPLKIYQGRVTS